MNKIKIFIKSISSTALFSVVVLIAMSFVMVIFPLAYYQSFARISTEDMQGYNNDIADYCVVDFYAMDNKSYKELSKTFDMENFAGLASYGSYTHIVDEYETHYYSLNFVSEKMVKELPSLGYNFSSTKPKNYKEAYVPRNLRYHYKIGDKIPIKVYEGEYKYETDLKIMGFCDNEYYDFRNIMGESFLNNMWSDFLIYDDIPDYAEIDHGLMMSDKKPEYYKNLGVQVHTVREINNQNKVSDVNNIFLYWAVCGIFLLITIVLSNYYFASDKLIKRSGVMYIYGGKRASIIAIELVKMLLLFILAFAISTVTIAIVISSPASGMIDWKTHFICEAIIFVVYFISILPGFIKFARFKPLKALANNNVDS